MDKKRAYLMHNGPAPSSAADLNNNNILEAKASRQAAKVSTTTDYFEAYANREATKSMSLSSIHKLSDGNGNGGGAGGLSYHAPHKHLSASTSSSLASSAPSSSTSSSSSSSQAKLSSSYAAPPNPFMHTNPANYYTPFEPVSSKLSTPSTKPSSDIANDANHHQANGSIYFVNSNGKFNIFESQNQPNLFNNSKISDTDLQLLSLVNSDLPNLKKLSDIPLYPSLNYPSAETTMPANAGMSSVLSNENYFNSLYHPNSSIAKNTKPSTSVPSVSQTQAFVQRPSVKPTGKVITNGDRPASTRGRKKSRKGPFICDECHKEFSNQSTLTKHMITHSDERKFVCSQCSKAFKRHDHLNGHMLTHREQKPYACELPGCDKSYCDARSLRRHREKHREGKLAVNEASETSKSQRYSLDESSDKAPVVSNANLMSLSAASMQLQYLALQQSHKGETSSTTNIENEAFNVPKLSNPAASSTIAKTGHDLNDQAYEHPNSVLLRNQNALLHQLLTGNNANAVGDDKVKTSHHNEHLLLAPSERDNKVMAENEVSECTVCQKKFKSRLLLQAHVRHHHGGDLFKMNYLLSSKSEIKGINNNLHLISQHQPQHEDNNFMYDAIKDNDFQANLYKEHAQTSQQLVCHNQTEFKMPLDYIDSINKTSNVIGGSSVPNSCHSSLYGNKTPTVTKYCYSPITPVTPQCQTQFPFDFNVDKQQQQQQQQQQLVVDDGEKEAPIIDYGTIDSDLINNNYCFQVNDKNVQQDDGALNKNEMNIVALDVRNEQHNFETENDASYYNPHHAHQFSLPSGKLASDLYNRRLRKNGREEDEEKIKDKELLSIKKIAASLESFSQTFEQNQHHLNHSYSVPTTPCMSSTQYANTTSESAYANNQSNNNANNMAHHSLPTTPINVSNTSLHFTFNIAPEMCHQSSCPTTPLDHGSTTTTTTTQFDFSGLNNNQVPANEDDFDLSLSLDESHYHANDYIYNPKDYIHNNDHFKQPSLVQYETAANNRQQQQLRDAIYEQLADPGQAYQDDHFNFRQTDLYDSMSHKEGDQQQQLPLLGDAHLENHAAECSSEQQIDSVEVQPTLEPMISTTIEPSEDVNANFDTTIEDPQDTTVEKSLERTRVTETSAANHPSSLIKSMKKAAILCSMSSPSGASSSSLVVPHKKKKHRPAPLYIPPHVNTYVFQSRLRSPRVWKTEPLGSHVSPPPYTPPPMLSPIRSGSGLFWKITTTNLPGGLNKFHAKTMLNDHKSDVSSSALVGVSRCLKTPTTAYEPYEYADIPHSDALPHVNIGPNYQARIPAFNAARTDVRFKSDRAHLVWHFNVLEHVDDKSLDLLLKLSSSLCLPGGGNNVEYALHLLHMCNGNVIDTLSKLIDSDPVIDRKHPLADYQYSHTNNWSADEIGLFQKSLLKHDKDFFLISREIKTKTVKECIEFYYLWKKNKFDIVKRLRFLRRRRENEANTLYYNIENVEQKGGGDDGGGGGGGDRKRKNGDLELDNLNGAQTLDGTGCSEASKTATLYPCDKCDKKFKRLKSRNAHLRSHIS